METEEILSYLFIGIVLFSLFFLFGAIFEKEKTSKNGIEETSYWKEVQIDTIQYNYQQDMYKYQIKVIK